MRTLLSLGIVYTLVQNEVYTMPARRSLGVTSAATLEGSLDGTTFVALSVSAAGTFETAYPFIRSTGVGTLVRMVAN